MRKAGDRIRITVQLIDAETDRHIWAERYDRELEDIFAIQDEITGAIVATLPGRVEAADARPRAAQADRNMAAYECVLAAKVLHHRSRARTMPRRSDDRPALALDPELCARPCLAACIAGPGLGLWLVRGSRRHLRAGGRELEIALALDDNDSDVHRILAALNLNRDDHDKAATIRSARSRSTPTTTSSSCSRANF